MNEKAQSTHLRVAVVQYDAIAALHRHHRRPVGARGGSLDASYVPPERDARAVAVGRHAHAASVTTPALRAVSDDAPTAVGERLCAESTGRRRRATQAPRMISFFFRATDVSFAKQRSFQGLQIVQKNMKLTDGLFSVYFARSG